MLPIVEFLGREIGTYSICMIVGLLVSAFLAYHLGKRDGFSLEEIVFVVLWIALGIVLGGHLLYGITHYDVLVHMFSNFSKLGFKQIWSTLVAVFGGMVFYGGFIGAIFTLKIYTRKFKEPKKTAIMDIYAVCVPLFHCFGRIGCFLGGCCYGVESKLGFTVTDNQIVPDVNGVRRLPVALIEAYFNLLLFALLLKIFKSERFKGRMLYLYMFFYSIIRFNIEFYRGDEIRGIWFGYSTSQWISIVLFAISFLYFVFHLKSTFKEIFKKGDGRLPTNKNIYKTIALSLLTLGIYGIYVMTSVSQNINKAVPNKKRTMNYCLLYFVFTPLTLGIALLVWRYRLAKKLDKELTDRNIDYLFTKEDFWLWNVLGLIVLVGPIVFTHKILKATNLINEDYNKQNVFN